MAKFLGTLLAIIIGVLIGGYFMHQMTDIDLKPKVHSEEESQVILEKIKKQDNIKMPTSISDIYASSSYWTRNIWSKNSGSPI